MTTLVDKFQMFLRELFQFDCAGLNFGIYRGMNCKLGIDADGQTRERVADVPKTFIPKAKALEPMFKARMFAQVQA